jgi:hypothetical protein
MVLLSLYLPSCSPAGENRGIENFKTLYTSALNDNNLNTLNITKEKAEKLKKTQQKRQYP